MEDKAITVKSLIDLLHDALSKYGDLGVCVWNDRELLFPKGVHVYGDDRVEHIWFSIDVEQPERC